MIPSVFTEDVAGPAVMEGSQAIAANLNAAAERASKAALQRAQLEAAHKMQLEKISADEKLAKDEADRIAERQAKMNEFTKSESEKSRTHATELANKANALQKQQNDIQQQRLQAEIESRTFEEDQARMMTELHMSEAQAKRDEALNMSGDLAAAKKAREEIEAKKQANHDALVAAQLKARTTGEANKVNLQELQDILQTKEASAMAIGSHAATLVPDSLRTVIMKDVATRPTGILDKTKEVLRTNVVVPRALSKDEGTNALLDEMMGPLSDEFLKMTPEKAVESPAVVKGLLTNIFGKATAVAHLSTPSHEKYDPERAASVEKSLQEDINKFKEIYGRAALEGLSEGDIDKIIADTVTADAAAGLDADDRKARFESLQGVKQTVGILKYMLAKPENQGISYKTKTSDSVDRFLFAMKNTKTPEEYRNYIKSVGLTPEQADKMTSRLQGTTEAAALSEVDRLTSEEATLEAQLKAVDRTQEARVTRIKADAATKQIERDEEIRKKYFPPVKKKKG